MKILIVTEKIAGNGHVSVAKTIAEYLENNAEISSEIIYTISIVSVKLEKILQMIYRRILKHKANLWGWLYFHEYLFRNIVNIFLVPLFIIPLYRLINFKKPDYLIVTHVFSLKTLSLIKRIRKAKFKIAVIMTDFYYHSFWLNSQVDLYFVPHEKIKSELIKLNISSDKIFVTGIPVNMQYKPITHEEKELLRGKLNIYTNYLTVVLLGGGWGLGPIEELLTVLNKSKEKLQIIVITGFNNNLYSKLLKLVDNSNNNFYKIYQFRHDLRDFILAADVVITKPGGITINEVMQANIPLILLQPIPGQEEQNSRFLISYQAAMIAKNIEDVLIFLNILQKNKFYFLNMQKGIRMIIKDNPTKILAEKLINY